MVERFVEIKSQRTNGKMLPIVLTLAIMVASTPYDSLRYNCWDYSTDLVKDLRVENITARIITGVAFGGAHTWVEVNNEWIEATDGTVITDRSLYKMGYYSPPKGNPYKYNWLKEHEIN